MPNNERREGAKVKESNVTGTKEPHMVIVAALAVVQVCEVRLATSAWVAQRNYFY
jgi:hypothetical protein